MALPLSTTTIRVQRPVASEDPTETPSAPEVVATGVPAHFSSPSTVLGEGGRQLSTWSLFSDPVDLRSGDQVVDEGSDVPYHVAWAVARDDDGELDHVRASVTLPGAV